MRGWCCRESVVGSSLLVRRSIVLRSRRVGLERLRRIEISGLAAAIDQLAHQKAPFRGRAWQAKGGAETRCGIIAALQFEQKVTAHGEIQIVIAELMFGG